MNPFQRFSPYVAGCLLLCVVTACAMPSAHSTADARTQSKDRKVRLVTLDPGHFHAALVQKAMYTEVDPEVAVYAPPGPDVQQHLDRIEAYNTRSDAPTG